MTKEEARNGKRHKLLVVFLILGLPLLLLSFRTELWRIEAAFLQHKLNRFSAIEDAKYPGGSPRPVKREELEVYMKLHQIRMAHDSDFAAKHHAKMEQNRASRQLRASMQAVPSTASVAQPEINPGNKSPVDLPRTSIKASDYTYKTEAFVIPTASQSTNAGFTFTRLSPDFHIHLPDTWKVFGKSENALISQNALAVTSGESDGIDNKTGRSTLVRVTCVPSSLYGTLTVHSYDECHLSPEDARQLISDPDGKAAIRDVVLSELEPMKKLVVISNASVSFTSVSGYPAVKISFTRSGGTNNDTRPVAVATTRIYAKNHTYSIAASYRVAEKNVIEPILDYCMQSIRIDER
jgi:hypothetical protein